MIMVAMIVTVMVMPMCTTTVTATTTMTMIVVFSAVVELRDIPAPHSFTVADSADAIAVA